MLSRCLEIVEILDRSIFGNHAVPETVKLRSFGDEP